MKTITNIEKIQSLLERITHSDTMRRLTPAENEWLTDALFHRENLSKEERDCFDNLYYS